MRYNTAVRATKNTIMNTVSGWRLSRRSFVGAACAAAAVSSRLHAAGAGRGPEIWFIRHAESALADSPGSTPADDAVRNVLTPAGVEQAKALALSLDSIAILAIYASTHLRAVQTADAIAFRRNLTMSPAPEAVEIDLGVEAGEDSAAVYRELTQQWLADGNHDARHGRGESFADAQRRFLPFVRELMNRYALDAGVVVIVAHGALLGLMTPALAANIPPDFALRRPLPYAGIVKTQLHDGRLHCTEWAGTPSSRFEAKTEPPRR